MRNKLCLFLLCLSLGFSANRSCMVFESNIPDIGQEPVGVIDAASEKLMGGMLMQQLRASNQLTEDPLVNLYLGELGQRISSHAHIQHFKLNFFGIDSKQPNAFAFFGGNVAVHSGLILMVGSESELAAVLAHETAHIAQRHLARILTSNKKLMPLTLAEILAACVIGALGAPEAGMHLATAALGGHLQQLINFTREHEQEADRIGIQILSDSGFNPHAMSKIFNRLHKQTQYLDKPPEYLLTHPMFASRMADAENRAESMHYHPKPDSPFFHFIRARIEVSQTASKKTMLALFKQKLNTASSMPNRLATHYEYALLLSKNKQYQTAKQELQTLIQQEPNQWIFHLALAEVESEMGDIQTCLHRTRALYDQYPDNPAIGLTYAQYLIDARKPMNALPVLAQLKSQSPDNLMVLNKLGHCLGLLKRRSELHMIKAEWHALRGEFKEAFQQLELSLDAANGNVRLIDQIKTNKSTLEKVQKIQKSLKL